MRITLAVVVMLLFIAPIPAQREHGFDNGKPSGQPYWSAEESLKGFAVPDGWEVKLFAAEPDVVNPIAFTIDERGRVWVVECFEYPSKTPKDKMPRDRIKMLEDTDGDGQCDKVTNWAEGKDFPVRFDLASGIEVGNGGVYLGAPPYLFHLRDTKGEGKCDKHEILLTGFGSQDTHEILNTFQWGPDGKLHGLHGVFTQSEVQGVKMNAAVWRYDPRAKKFDRFAEGTSNPWGMDFDANGQCFLTCCVIPHLFHMIPGGNYIRQAGSGFNPYAFGELKEICDHTHHKESGWAHAGLLHLDGKHVPEEFRGSVLMGSIHGCSIKRDALRRNGSTYIAGHEKDFLTSKDKNFRPINLRWGPDGSIYLIDWHDQNPCHQAKPESWDQKHGRIYRIQRKGNKNTPPGDWAKKADQELVDALLGEENPWAYRTALRLLIERRGQVADEIIATLKRKALQKGDAVANLRAHWAIFGLGKFDEALATEGIGHESPWVRAWSVRFIGESDKASEALLKKLAELAKTEKSEDVRLQLASTAGRLAKLDTKPILQNLMHRKEDAKDPCIPLMIWFALEPKFKAEPEMPKKPGEPEASAPGVQAILDWLKENAPGNPLVTNEIVPRTMRRLTATGKKEDLNACVHFIHNLTAKDVRLSALRGLAEQLKGMTEDTPSGWPALYAELQKETEPEVRKLSAQLAISFQDLKALQAAVAVFKDAAKPKADRIEAIRSLTHARYGEALPPLLNLVVNDKEEEVRKSAASVLAVYEDNKIASTLLEQWKNLPAAVRAECVLTLKTRKEWARQMLEAVGKGTVAPTELGAGVILAIRNFNDARLNELIEKHWGHYRQTPEELEKLLNKMRGAMYEGKADPAKGKLVFEKHCMQCHKFEGQGHDVGPNLDGAERGIEYLLVNIIDPNRVVGRPYYQRVILKKDGKLVTGLLHAEDDTAVTIKLEKNQLEVVARKDIDKMRTEEKSAMPEGLDKNMEVQDLRDLVRYLMANPFITDVRRSQMIESPGGFDKEFGPEKDEPLKAKDVQWTAPDVGPAGLIRVERQEIKNVMTDSIQYLYAEVTAPAAMKTRLWIGSPFPAKAWLNGKLVAEGKFGKLGVDPDQIAVEVQLEKGVNRLLVKVMNTPLSNGVYLRLADPDRKLTYGVEKE